MQPLIETLKQVSAEEHVRLSFSEKLGLISQIHDLAGRDTLTPKDQGALLTDFYSLSLRGGRDMVIELSLGLKRDLSPENMNRLLSVLQTDEDRVEGIIFRHDPRPGYESTISLYALVREALKEEKHTKRLSWIRGVWRSDTIAESWLK